MSWWNSAGQLLPVKIPRFKFLPLTVMGSTKKQVTWTSIKQNKIRKVFRTEAETKKPEAVCSPRFQGLHWGATARARQGTIGLCASVSSSAKGHKLTLNLKNFCETKKLTKHTQRTWMPNYYLIIQCAHIRMRQAKPQINLIPYAVGYIFQKPSKVGIYSICRFILFSVPKHVHTSKQTQLSLNYLVEDYPRFLLFLPFPVAHFLASLAVPSSSRKGDGTEILVHCHFDYLCHLSLHSRNEWDHVHLYPQADVQVSLHYWAMIYSYQQISSPFNS